jgi:hypothetical protein
MRRGVARPDQHAAGRLLEDAGDRIPREMTVRDTRDRGPTGPGLQTGGTRMAVYALDQRVRNREMGEITRRGLGAALACVVTVAAACAPSPAPQPAPVPAAAQPPAAPTPERSGSLPRFVTGHAVYDITAVGLVTDPGDSSGRQDTVTTNTILSYDTHWLGPQLEASGEIISRVMAASATMPRADTTQGTRTTFRATVDTASGIVTVAPDSGATLDPCRGRDPSVDQARKLATTRPRSFAPSATWRDVVNDSSCLGGLPLVSRSTRDYTVAPQGVADPATGSPAVLISHTSTTTMAGSGHRAGHYIALYGSGSGTTQEYYDRKTGVLLSAHTVATLDLNITLSGHVQRLHQQADWRAKIKGAPR